MKDTKIVFSDAEEIKKPFKARDLVLLNNGLKGMILPCSNYVKGFQEVLVFYTTGTGTPIIEKVLETNIIHWTGVITITNNYV
jgi:Ni2+-binding GTPase involved in maturation of urease and hydrogenase